MAQFRLNLYNEFNREFKLRSLYFKKLFFNPLSDQIAVYRVRRSPDFTPQGICYSRGSRTSYQALKNLPFIQEIITNQAQGNSLNLVVTPEPNSLTQIEKTLAEANFSIFSMTQSRPSLDDVYLAARGTRDLKSEQKQQMK